MKKIFSILITFFLATILFSSATKKQDIKNFKKVNSYFTKKFPSSFTCQVSGKRLQESVKKLPKEAILNKKNIKIVLLFNKIWGSRVILKGVEEPFADRFSYIENVFDFIFPFIKNKTYKKFIAKYTIFDSKKNNFKFKKRHTKGGYLQIFLKKNVVTNVKEFKNNKLLMNMKITYRKLKKYKVPVNIKIFFYEENNKLKILNFKLMNFNFKPKLKEDDFLG